MMTPSVVVSSPSSSLTGDYIATESCFDLFNDGGGLVSCCQNYGEREQRSYWKTRTTSATKREIPPPIPSLARNNNMPCHTHMPWVLKRYHTSDGRLILKEEKVGRFNEYFRAHRSNGRLILHLVPFKNGEIDDEEANADDEEEAQICNFDNEKYYRNKKNGDDDDDDNSNSNIIETSVKDDDELTEIEDSIVKCPITEKGIVAANGGKCLKYSSVRTSPTCFLGLQVPAIRPVHT